LCGATVGFPSFLWYTKGHTRKAVWLCHGLPLSEDESLAPSILTDFQSWQLFHSNLWWATPLFCSLIFSFSAYSELQLLFWDQDWPYGDTSLRWPQRLILQKKCAPHLLYRHGSHTQWGWLLCKGGWVHKQEYEIETRTISRLGLEDYIMFF
jgi:hypothetical protein